MSEFSEALSAVRKASDSTPEALTTDDVWPLLGFIPTEPNIIGKAFAEANRLGIIEGTERFVKLTRPEAKGRRVQVWRRANGRGLF